MYLKGIVKLLANRINQPHVIETYLRKIERGAYKQGFIDGIESTKYEEQKPVDKTFTIRMKQVDITDEENLKNLIESSLLNSSNILNIIKTQET